MRRFRSDRAGGTAVEMALVLPFAVGLLYAGLDLGWAMHCGSSVREAMQQASRALISNPNLTDAQLAEKAMQRLAGLPVDNLEVQVSQEWVTGNAQVARVTWTYDYATALPLAPSKLFHFGSSLVVPRAEA